ncbi:MAG: helix-turn-helix transcriptional regulator [Clostridia bacterium]|jgi:transcriptional regulator with XRE-family HTH domain|nr:helix-turn-helix transcriptional regulator [Clostridia bacterium]
MDTIGQRIRRIRKINNLTTEQFADKIMCNPKTIQRYENEKSLPDCYNLKRISVEFGISTDYILGLSDKMEVAYQTEDIMFLYQKYKKMTLNPIKKEDYYWIQMKMEEDKNYVTSIQTECTGIIEESSEGIKEIRKARKVIPENVIKICEQLKRNVVIINKVSEIGLFYLFGGEAIIREELCKEHMKEILEPFIVDIKKY